MRILFLSHDLPTPQSPDRGRFIARHRDILELDHDVTTVLLQVGRGLRSTAHLNDGEFPGSVVCSVATPPGFSDAAMAEQLIGMAGEHDVIHSNALESARVARLVARKTGQPWIHTEHSSLWTDPLKSVTSRLRTIPMRSSVTDADVTTAVSDYLADAMQVHTGRRPIVVPNVIDVPNFDSRPTHSQGTNRIRVVTTGALVDYKDPLLAAGAMAAAGRELGFDVEWTWIGRGPLADPFLGACAGYGISQHVRLMGPMAPAAYFAETARHDFFFLPSRYETFCVAAAEALALGLPVVMGPRGGHTEYVGPPHGIAAHAHSVDSYASAIIAMAESRAWLNPGPCRVAVARFRPDAVRERMAAAYACLTGAA
jgi:glycosyltransferase involved in cell wall biosynthesis